MYIYIYIMCIYIYIILYVYIYTHICIERERESERVVSLGGLLGRGNLLIHSTVLSPSLLYSTIESAQGHMMTGHSVETYGFLTERPYALSPFALTCAALILQHHTASCQKLNVEKWAQPLVDLNFQRAV